jgi:rod shape-determining protein MreC
MAYDNKKKTIRPIRIIAILALVIPVVMTIIASTLGRRDFKFPHKLTLELLGSVQGVFSSSVSVGKDFWNHYFVLVGVSRENEQLRLELQELRAKNLGFREAAATNVSLRQLLDLEKSSKSPTVTAQIVGHDPSLWFKTLTINKGSSSGIEKGMPVITVGGVVGQVSNLSPNYAKVILSIDPNSAIDAAVQGNRVQGIIKGKGQNYRLHYVLKNSEVLKGDQIITSGMGGVFPKGLAVGVVSDVLKSRRGMFQKIEVSPSVNFRKLEYVSVVLKKYSSAE